MNVQEILSVRVPKYFWIPSKNRFITAGQMVQLWKFCKENPGLEVKESIQGWWPSTTDEVLKQIRDAMHERIYLRQFVKP